METIKVTTRRGLSVEVHRYGSAGEPIVFFHGAVGPLSSEPTLEALSESHQVFAPVWPGYGELDGEQIIEDMLDFTLHGSDICIALQAAGYLSDLPFTLMGHCMGAMIAAEMAAISPDAYSDLILIAPLGIWIDESPIPDLFAMLPFEFGKLLFADGAIGTEVLLGGQDFYAPGAMERFVIANARRLGTAGRILFPIPNRRLAKRLYRITAPTTLVFGGGDQMLDPSVYPGAWATAITHANVHVVNDSGHYPTVEQSKAVVDIIRNRASSLQLAESSQSN